MNRNSKTLRKTTIASIKRHSMEQHEWYLTKYYETELLIDSEQTGYRNFQESELPVASIILNENSWTIVTTERVIGKNNNEIDSIPLENIKNWTWGNFKRDKEKRTTNMTLATADGQTFDFVIETGKASMVMIYAVRTLTQLKRK